MKDAMNIYKVNGKLSYGGNFARRIRRVRTMQHQGTVMSPWMGWPRR